MTQTDKSYMISRRVLKTMTIMIRIIKTKSYEYIRQNNNHNFMGLLQQHLIFIMVCFDYVTMCRVTTGHQVPEVRQDLMDAMELRCSQWFYSC